MAAGWLNAKKHAFGREGSIDIAKILWLGFHLKMGIATFYPGVGSKLICAELKSGNGWFLKPLAPLEFFSKAVRGLSYSLRFKACIAELVTRLVPVTP